MRSDRLPAMLALTAALLAGAPGARATGASWISLCGAGGAQTRLLVGKDGLPIRDHDAGTACHAACTLPRKALRESRDA